MSIDKKTLKNIFLGIAGLIVLSWLLHETERVKTVIAFFESMLSPFVAGALLAFVLNVPMRAIENRLKIKHAVARRAVSLTLTLVLILLVLVLVFWLLIPQVISTAVTLFYQIRDLVNQYPQMLKWLQAGDAADDINWGAVADKIINLAGQGVPSLVNGAISTIGLVYNGIFNAVVAVVFSIYCLARKDILCRQFKRLAYAFLPEKFCDHAIHILKLTNHTFSNFISGQCIEACILGCLFAIAMTIFQMPYVPLISVLIAVTALVPIVGAFIGCVLGAFFILVGNPVQALWFVVMFLVLQQIENNVIYPKVVGKSVGLPGMWVLLAVAVGGTLMGVVGMVLMIPVVSVFYTLLREYTAARLDKRGISADKVRNSTEEKPGKSRKAKKDKEDNEPR